VNTAECETPAEGGGEKRKGKGRGKGELAKNLEQQESQMDGREHTK